VNSPSSTVSEKSLISDSENVPESTPGIGSFHTSQRRRDGNSRSLKYGTDFKTWLFAYKALGLQTLPELSLRENKTILVSINFPEEMASFRASCRAVVTDMMLDRVSWKFPTTDGHAKIRSVVPALVAV